MNAADGAGPIVSLCAFEIEGQGFAIDLRRVREILRPQRVTPVPGAPAAIEGVIRLRDDVIPVVDLRKRLGVARPSDGPSNRLIIAWVGRRLVGLLVDRIADVVRVERSSLLPAPDLWVEGGVRCFVGTCGDGDDLRLLLDVEALLASNAPAVLPSRRPARTAEGPG